MSDSEFKKLRIVICIILAVLIGFLVRSIAVGKIYARHGYTLRDQDPFTFWSLVVLYAFGIALGVIMLLIRPND